MVGHSLGVGRQGREHGVAQTGHCEGQACREAVEAGGSAVGAGSVRLHTLNRTANLLLES